MISLELAKEKTAYGRNIFRPHFEVHNLREREYKGAVITRAGGGCKRIDKLERLYFSFSLERLHYLTVELFNKKTEQTLTIPKYSPF